MIRKVVWSLFVLIVISENHCSQIEHDLYAFSTLASTPQSTTDGKSPDDNVQDAETAETITRSSPWSGATNLSPEDVSLEDSQEDPPGPEDHVIPYSEHENPKEPPTRPKYVAPGAWAKPDPKKNIPLDFVPTKSLAQVRGTHTFKVLPQSDAIASATTDEERENAHRLREVVSKKKTNTIYTEEGYEDSAYDHGGHIRDADFHEGYARKLHDQHGKEARSGTGGQRKSKKKKKSRTKNSRIRPEEFEEFKDDYSDEHASTDKYDAEGSSKKTKKQNHVNKIYRDMWKKPDVNPKIVTENEIEKLENDLKREAEEAEKGSENYGSGTERDVPRDYSGEDTNSEDSQYSQRIQSDIEKSTGSPTFESKENFYTENYDATTVQFETPRPGGSENYEASTSDYENPTTNNYYLPDGSAIQENYEATTFNYNYPNNPQSIIGDSPIAPNYGEIFWKYFQTQPNEATSPSSYLQEQTTIQQPLLVRETTTLGPYDEQSSPLAVATINGHGPYLLVSENGEVTQNPNQFDFGGLSYYPNAILNQEYGFTNGQGINSRSGESFSGNTDSGGPATSGYGSWGLNNGEYNAHGIPVISTETPTTRFYDNIAFSSTPIYSFITPPPNNYAPSKSTTQKDSTKQKNPFLNSAEDTAESHDSLKHGNVEASYKNWLTNNQDPNSERVKEQSTSGSGPNESPNPLSSKSHGDKGMSFFGYKPNLEYSKMLNFIKNHKNGRNSGQKSESANSEDFTIMKPPTLRESVFSDFTLNSYPNVAGYSSVTLESETAQEAKEKRVDAKKNSTKHNGLSQKDMNFKTPTIKNSHAAVFNRKRLFPASKLLPPAPYSRDNYADLNFANQRNGYYEFSEYPNSHYSPNDKDRVQNYSPDPEQLERYLKSRKTPPRYIRSLDEAALTEERVANALIAQEINARLNFTLKDQGSTKSHDVVIPEKNYSRVKRNLIPQENRTVTEDLLQLANGEDISNKKDSKFKTERRLREKRSHQDLLDASHKIAGDVIDKEIDSRFKSKDYDAVDGDDHEEGEEDDEKKGERQIEIEDPDLDYLDEIQEFNEVENIPTTTAASIDFQKYPFYKSAKVSNSSPLKYIINPKEVPKKTFGGMEFYDSRDKYVQCDEVDPNLGDVVPDDEEPVPNRGPKENLPRLRGLGDKLDCFKAKYFGENPFDNPLFFESKVNQPTPPTELNPMKLVARILEMPEENRNYFVPAQSRKPETMAIKRIDHSHRRTKSRNLAESSNTKSVVESRTRGRNNPHRGKVKDSSTEQPQRDTRRSRKRRPVQRQRTTTTTTTTTTTELPEINSVTPYQKEVYDDVMGTIKNLASLYEMFEAQTTPPATTISPHVGHILGAPSIRNVKTLNRDPALNGKREKDFHSTGSKKIPSNEEIEGLLPPPELSRKPKIMPYRTNKVSYNTRVRTESPPRNGDKKIIGYFRTVMVHKRSLDDHVGIPSAPEIEVDKHTVKKRYVMDSEFEETRANQRSVNPNTSSSTTERPKRGRRRKTNLTTTTTTTVDPITSDARTDVGVKTSKSLYTIRGRARNSKDEKTTEGYGMFTTTQRPSATIDARRNEPRYTEILRRRGQTATTTPRPEELSESTSITSTTNPGISESLVEPVTESREIYESEDTVPRRKKVSIDEIEPSGEIYKAIASEFEPEHAEEEEDDDDSDNYEEERDEESTDEPVKRIRKYDVHEDVQEDTTPSVVGFPKPTKTSDYVDLETFLSTDPPGYTKAFSDEVEPTVPYSRVNGPDVNKENYRDEESKEEQVEEDNDEYRGAPENASYQEEESSEEDNTESPRNSESYKDSSSENGDEKRNSEQEDGEEKPFSRYDIRPDSPFESFEDDKYSELGPRVNKPAFHHPPFEAPKFERKYFQDSEETEKDKTDESSENEKYAFPWSHDDEDEKAEAAEGFVDENAEKYEYPWEKRERLAEERAKRRKDRERLKKLRDFSFLHDDDEYDEDEDEKKGSPSQVSGKHVYPWDAYDMPSKPYKNNFWKTGNFDSDETSSEHRPVAKFSSKYNSNKFKLPLAGSEPITGAEPKKIRKSILKFLKEVDEKTFEPTVAYETAFSSTSKPAPLIETPNSQEQIKSTVEPVSSGSKNNKRLSNAGIVPENITTAPRSRIRSRVTFIRERTTLRPSLRSTTKAVVVEKSQTTETPIATTRRPSRVRGRPNSTRQQPSYKAQESQIAPKTVEPKPTLTTTSTTEEPVKPSTKSRRRGNSKTVNNAAKTNGNTNLQSQRDVTERSTQATTTIRRRTRPTVTTKTTKSAQKNYEKPRRPGRVDNRNLVKETTYDEYRIPTVSSVDSGDHDTEDSTPASRTVEHRSRVSKEQIITKTSFPELDTTYKAYADKSMMKQINPINGNSKDNQKSKKTYSKIPDRGSNSFGGTKTENENPVRNESVEELSITTKETPEHVYKKEEILDKDGHRGMFISIIPKNRTIGSSAVEDELHLKKARMEDMETRKEQGYDNFDGGETQDAAPDEDIGGVFTKDRSIVNHELHEIPSQSKELKETNDSHDEEYSSFGKDKSPDHEDRYTKNEKIDESEDVDESEEESPVVNFEEDPSRRLYYYLDPKK